MSHGARSESVRLRKTEFFGQREAASPSLARQNSTCVFITKKRFFHQQWRQIVLTYDLYWSGCAVHVYAKYLMLTASSNFYHKVEIDNADVLSVPRFGVWYIVVILTGGSSF